jgi:hypothetical protein
VYGLGMRVVLGQVGRRHGGGAKLDATAFARW